MTTTVPLGTFIIGLSLPSWTNFLGPNLAIFYGSVILSTRPDFLSEVLCCDNGRRGPIGGWRHSDFLSHWSQSTQTYFLLQTNCWKEMSNFLSDQNRFSLRFFVYDKNWSVCTGHYCNDMTMAGHTCDTLSHHTILMQGYIFVCSKRWMLGRKQFRPPIALTTLTLIFRI